MCSQTRAHFPLSTQPRSLAANPPSSVSGPSRKTTRKAVFQIFCDDDTQPAPASIEPLTRRTHKAATALQTIVNNKENEVPELNNRTISAPRQANRASTRPRVLGDKTLAASARVNCVEKWDSKIPFAPCASSLGKSTLLHPIKTEQQPKPRVRPQTRSSKGTTKEPKNAGCDTQSAKRLSSHIYCAGSENGGPSSSVDEGLAELVAKLEALQAKDADGAGEMLEPLPPNAACPGAPKMPSTFVMPVFVADDAQPGEFKPPGSLQMSPLAEVTEAFTGLQGGWSPPLETSSPVFNSHFFHNISIRPDHQS